jgi:hypothetical protein
MHRRDAPGKACEARSHSVQLNLHRLQPAIWRLVHHVVTAVQAKGKWLMRTLSVHERGYFQQPICELVGSCRAVKNGVVMRKACRILCFASLTLARFFPTRHSLELPYQPTYYKGA